MGLWGRKEMADLERGFKWWLRYIIVPIIVPLLAGGGIIAVLISDIFRQSHPPTALPPGSHDGESKTQQPQGQKPMDFYLKWNTVIPGPLLKQYKFADADYNSCMQECENNPKCLAWVFGPVPLPPGVKYNCGLKFAVTGKRIDQNGVVSGYVSRYQQAIQ